MLLASILGSPHLQPFQGTGYFLSLSLSFLVCVVNL